MLTPKGRRTGWNDDESAVIEAPRELAARRFLGPKPNAIDSSAAVGYAAHFA
jgi:hypothetical protein